MIQNPTYSWIAGLLAGLFLISCTQDSDGPMKAWDSGEHYQGQGLYFAGNLDYGRRVHAKGDSLPVRMDSLWVVSTCYLKSLTPVAESQGETLYLGFRLWLESDASILCPASPIGGDTTILLPPNSDWNSLSRIFLRGAVDSVAIDTVDRTAPLTDQDRFGSLVDSIWVLAGRNEDSTFTFVFDSSFSDYQKLPQQVGDGPWVLRFLHPPRIGKNFWALTPMKCNIPRSTCTLVPDTTWPELSFNDTTESAANFDTNAVAVKQRCKGDSTSVNYCSNRDWVRDSSLAIVYGSGLDTLWAWNTFFVEKIPRCAVLNRDTLYSYLSGNAGGSVKIWRELFLPSASEKHCGIPWPVKVDSTLTHVEFEGTVLEDWLVYSLDRSAIVLDTALADSVVGIIKP